MKYLKTAAFICSVFSTPLILHAQNTADSLARTMLNVYFDREYCDLDFFKTEITFVNHVVDRTVADVHVLITAQETASEGTEYTLFFIGQKNFQGMTDTLKYIAYAAASDDNTRRGLLQRIKLGLMRYVAKTAAAADIAISAAAKTKTVPIVDRWNNWVFSVGIDAYLEGEQSYKHNYLYGSISVNRTTEIWKFRNSIYYDYTKNLYKLNDSTTISSLSKSYGADGTAVRSLDEHWSAGLSGDIYSSTYSNIDMGHSVQPALEYDIFPYSQSTSREIRILYNPGIRFYQYIDTTIYNKTEEILLFEYVSVTLDTKQRWGSIMTSIYGRHYLHDFGLNRLSAQAKLSLPLVKGLSFNLWGWIAIIHDQVTLSKQGLTPEEILLRIKQQKTQYDYDTSIGLSYSFGSMYSNIVNPRFGY